jgi:hypothetical protein
MGRIRDASRTHGLAGRRLAAAAAKDLTDDHLIDRGSVESALLQQSPHDRRRQIDGRHFRQRTPERPERRPQCFDNKDLTHIPDLLLKS